ncbi:hypothetical protein NFI96_000042 [Prochilodus magdalenae]|nr:hypothetical protein NFI96_000042 [Prochilodus magdalenae]
MWPYRFARPLHLSSSRDNNGSNLDVDKDHRGEGRKKKRKMNMTSLTLPAVPSCLPKVPLTCTQCNADFSCSWNQNTSGSFLCQSCFRCSWRKEHWPSIRSSSGMSVLPAAQAPKSDRMVPKMQVCGMSPRETSSSSLSSPNFYSDSSSYVLSPASSDLFSSPIHYSSSSYSSGLPYYSDPYSSSSSLSPSPPYFSQRYSSKKARTPYWRDSPLVKSLPKGDQVKQHLKAEKKKSTWNRPLYSREKTEKTGLSSSTLGSDHHGLQQAQVSTTDSVITSKALSTSVSRKSVPSLNTVAKVEHASQELNSSSKPSPGSFSSATPGSFFISSQSGEYLPKLSVHHTPSTDHKTLPASVNGIQQALRPKPGSCEWKPSSLISPTSSTHRGKTSQQGDIPQKVRLCPKGSAINKAWSGEHRMDKWTQTQNASHVTHPSTASVPSSAASGHPRFTQQALDSQKVKVDDRI